MRKCLIGVAELRSWVIVFKKIKQILILINNSTLHQKGIVWVPGGPNFLLQCLFLQVKKRAQLANTSKLITETLEQGVKYVQS